MPRASLDEIFGGSSAPVPLYQPANENDRNAAIADVYQPQRKSLDDIFGGQQAQAPMPQPPSMEQQSDNRFMADEPGYFYGGILPFRKNLSTGEREWAVPEMIRSPIRGMQDLENTAASGEVATGNPTITPDAVNAMASMFPFVGNIPAETSAAQALNTMPKDMAAIEKPNASKGFLANNQGEALPNTPIPTSEQLRQISSPMFEQGKTSSISLNPELSNAYADKAHSMTPQTEGEKIVFGKPSPAEEVAANIQGLRDRPLTLAETQGIDSRLGKLAEDHFDTIKGVYDSEGEKYLELQHHLRDTWGNATENDVTGGKSAYDKIIQARDVWAAQARMADIERLEKRAKLSENPQTIIKNGTKRLLINWRGSEEEKTALEAATKTGVIGGVLKFASSKAIDALVGSIAGHATGDWGAALVGGGIGAGIGRGATFLGNKLQTGRLANVKGVIADSPGVQAALKPMPMPQPVLALPAPEMINIADTSGHVIPLSPSGREIIGQSPSTASEQLPIRKAQSEIDYSQALEQQKIQHAATQATNAEQLSKSNPENLLEFIANSMQKHQDAGLSMGSLGQELMKILGKSQ